MHYVHRAGFHWSQTIFNPANRMTSYHLRAVSWPRKLPCGTFPSPRSAIASLGQASSFVGLTVERIGVAVSNSSRAALCERCIC